MTERDSDCSRLLTLEADSKGSVVDARMVGTAWDFDRINDLYREAFAVTKRFDPVAKSGQRAELDRWTVEEREAWRVALRSDPLLPAELLPKGYAGRKSWRLRKTILAKAARISNFLHPKDART